MELPDNLMVKSKWLKVRYGIIDVNYSKTKITLLFSFLKYNIYYYQLSLSKNHIPQVKIYFLELASLFYDVSKLKNVIDRVNISKNKINTCRFTISVRILLAGVLLYFI